MYRVAMYIGFAAVAVAFAALAALARSLDPR